MASLPELLSTAGDRRGGLAPGNGESEHGHGVREHVEERGRGRQREGTVERVFAASLELLAAARTARRGARRELG